MSHSLPTKMDRALARICHACPFCRTARTRQSGAVYRVVRKLESKVCPFCQAYERVQGHKAHERLLKRNAKGR
jgi:hypothetical protein